MVLNGGKMVYDVIVVGGGIAGLTAGAFLTKAGYTTLLCEKEDHCGGLVNSFERSGFIFDAGIRSIENSGIVFPMLRDLGLDIEFVKSRVSVGIEDKVIRIYSVESLMEYQTMLNELYPENIDEITSIIAQIKKIMKYLDILYGIDNPAFLDFKRDRDYMMKEIIPWVFKYILTAPKIAKLRSPVEKYLTKFTQNQHLLDIIAQHFFTDTPAFFALSYFTLYLDYNYPLGGTGVLPKKLSTFITKHEGLICTNTEIISVDPEKRLVKDANGEMYKYRALIWAADLNSLYQRMNPNTIVDDNVKQAILKRRADLHGKVGGDSVFTLYLALNLDKEYFASRATEHFFYTPSRIGQTLAGPVPVGGNRLAIEAWLKKFFKLTTYEISCPVMRDGSLAPSGQTGLIVSVLFDYQLTKHIKNAGWYEEFKEYCAECILETLENSIYPGMKQHMLDKFSYSPLSIERITGNTDGAITGWAFTNEWIPVETSLPKILNAVRTPIPGIHQAGQWTYSPSGLPISILTGKLAVDETIKALKKTSE